MSIRGTGTIEPDDVENQYLTRADSGERGGPIGYDPTDDQRLA